jgi:hypothetical protein
LNDHTKSFPSKLFCPKLSSHVGCPVLIPLPTWEFSIWTSRVF